MYRSGDARHFWEAKDVVMLAGCLPGRWNALASQENGRRSAERGVFGAAGRGRCIGESVWARVGG